MLRLFISLICLWMVSACVAQTHHPIMGADQLDILLPKLSGKRVGLVVNQTSVVKKMHLVDTLKSHGVVVVKAFAPEHGFRGMAADGELINDSVDVRTGIQLISVYGKNRKPTPEQLADIDIIIFDIQDVGARFYTYISTLTYVMEACAENGKSVIILDRPNPHGYVDGPMMQPEYKSFVGMHPIPVVHGLTMGEIAQMINGEGWLKNKVKCSIDIIKLKNWKHDDAYELPIKPSPNLPNNQAVRLYPSICFFEGTVISLGRGTPTPFQILGNPELKTMGFQFMPLSIKGVSINPPQENKLCYGIDLRSVSVPRRIDLHYLLDFYKAYPNKEKFFIPYFEKLAGTAALRQQIKDGLTEEQIRESWRGDLDKYQKMRKKYLLYQ